MKTHFIFNDIIIKDQAGESQQRISGLGNSKPS